MWKSWDTCVGYVWLSQMGNSKLTSFHWLQCIMDQTQNNLKCQYNRVFWPAGWRRCVLFMASGQIFLREKLFFFHLTPTNHRVNIPELGIASCNLLLNTYYRIIHNIPWIGQLQFSNLQRLDTRKMWVKSPCCLKEMVWRLWRDKILAYWGFFAIWS